MISSSERDKIYQEELAKAKQQIEKTNEPFWRWNNMIMWSWIVAFLIIIPFIYLGINIVHKENMYSKITVGQTKEQVKSLLGEPEWTDLPYRGFGAGEDECVTWFYGITNWKLREEIGNMKSYNGDASIAIVFGKDAAIAIDRDKSYKFTKMVN